MHFLFRLLCCVYFIPASNGFVNLCCISILSPSTCDFHFVFKGLCLFTSYLNLALVSYANVAPGGRLSGEGPRKTKLCNFHLEGRCRHEYNCMFAHSVDELGEKRRGNAFMTYGARATSYVFLSLQGLLQQTGSLLSLKGLLQQTGSLLSLKGLLQQTGSLLSLKGLLQQTESLLSLKGLLQHTGSLLSLMHLLSSEQR
jgi:hypothetical protein